MFSWFCLFLLTALIVPLPFPQKFTLRGKKYKALVILHGAAMQAAVLADDGAAIDADHLAVWVSLLDDGTCLVVKIRLSIGGVEYGTVDNQIVSVGGGQTVVAVVNGARHRQFQ